MFTTGAVFSRGLVVIPQYFPILLQSLFLSSVVSKKYCWSCRNNVRTTKVKVLFCLAVKFCTVPNWTLIQCPTCNVLLKSTLTIQFASLFSSGFLTWAWYVKTSYKSGDQSFNESLKVVGCNRKVTRTFTNLYPTHDCMNSWNSKLWPLSALPVPKGCLAIEVYRTNPAS